MRGACVVMWLAVAAAAVASVGAQQGGAYLDPPTNAFYLAWSVDGDRVTFDATVRGVGWIGVGFQPVSGDTGMGGGDEIVAEFAGGAVVSCLDYFTPQGFSGPPSLDTDFNGTDDVLAFSGAQNATVTTVSFVRALVTPDAAHDYAIVPSQPVAVMYAWGRSNAFGFHQGNAGHAVITLAASPSSAPPSPSPSASPPPTAGTERPHTRPPPGPAPRRLTGSEKFAVLLGALTLLVVAVNVAVALVICVRTRRRGFERLE